MVRKLQNLKQNGALLVEFALILPLFCMLVFGAIFGGMMIHDYSKLNDLARAAARYGAVETSGGNADTDENPETDSQKIANVKAYLRTHGDELLILYRVNGYSVTADTGDEIAGEPAINVVVTAERIGDIPLIVDSLLPKEISSSLKMRIENPE